MIKSMIHFHQCTAIQSLGGRQSIEKAGFAQHAKLVWLICMMVNQVKELAGVIL